MQSLLIKKKSDNSYEPHGYFIDPSPHASTHLKKSELMIHRSSDSKIRFMCAFVSGIENSIARILPSQQQIRSSGGGSFPFGTICMFHWGFPSLRTLLKIYFCRWGKTAALWLLLWRHLWYFYPRTPRLWRDSALTQRSTRLTRLFWRM